MTDNALEMTDFDPSDPASFTFWTEERLRFNDLDTVGHVNNNAIGVFLENARVTLLFDGGGDLLNSGDAVGQSWVIRKIDIDFIHEIRFPGVVQTGTRIARFGSSSCTVRQGIFVEGRCCVTATTIAVCFDATARTSMPIPESVRRRLARHVP